jgi:peptide/nickel transport system substrate-binding protein
MSKLNRRQVLALGAAMPLPLAAPALAQSDTRPVVTVAVQKISNTNSLEPLREQSNVGERVFLTSLFEGLIGRNYQGALQDEAMLATSWKRIDDRTVEFSLRQGVKFHNGETMTAEDVAYSFGPERMFGPEGMRPDLQGQTMRTTAEITSLAGKSLPPEVPAIARRMLPALERVEIVDRHTVRFVNRTPDVVLEGRLSRIGSEIVSRRGFESATSWLEWARKPVTSGPYKVREFRADSMLILDAHDEYWGGRPPIKELRFVEVPEVSSRINGLLSGQYTMATDLPPDQIETIERNRAFEVKGSTILNHRITVFDKNHPQLRDARVRRAFTHAIDRQAIVDALWGGRTAVPKGLQWEFYGPMYQADWSVPAFDQAEARRLLREAGYKGEPIPYRLLNNYYTNQVATAQVLVEMWRAVGLNVQIEMKENWQQIFDTSSQRGIRDWSNSAAFNDPVSSLVNQHGPNGQQQQMGEWTNEEMNRLSVELETSTDRARRRAVFRRLLEIAEREDPAYTVLHQNATFTAKRRDLKWQAAPAFAMDFRAKNWGG